MWTRTEGGRIASLSQYIQQYGAASDGELTRNMCKSDGRKYAGRPGPFRDSRNYVHGRKARVPNELDQLQFGSGQQKVLAAFCASCKWGNLKKVSHAGMA